MVKKTALLLLLCLFVMAICAAGVASLQTNLFHEIPWILIAAIIVGLAIGILRARAKQKVNQSGKDSPRHTLFSFLEHWGTEIGIIILKL
jgi:hypothetical protein